MQTPGLSRPTPQPRIVSLVKFTVKDLFAFTCVIRRDMLILELGKRDRGDVFLPSTSLGLFHSCSPWLFFWEMARCPLRDRRRWDTCWSEPRLPFLEAERF